MFVRDIPSGGLSNTVKSPVSGRIHHYITRQEYQVHLLAEYSPTIIDIRERFALLPWDETQAIASKLGIRHPRYPGTTTPTAITTDLLLTKRHLARISHSPVDEVGELGLKKVGKGRLFMA